MMADLRTSLQQFATGFISAYVADGYGHAAECLAADFTEMWDDDNTIRTVEQLNALAQGSIVQDAEQGVWQLDCDPDVREPWIRAGSAMQYRADEIELPALLLRTPRDGT